MLKSLADFYFTCVLKRPGWSLSAVLLLALFLASHLPNLKIDASSDSLTLEYDEDLDYYRELIKRYQSGDFLVVTYTADEDLFSQKSLDHLRALRDELLLIEGVASANSILDVPLLYSPPIGLLDVARGLKTLSDPDVDRTLVQNELLDSPIYKDLLLGPDKKTTAILLNLQLDNRFLELVRERDSLRLKRDTEGLSASEEVALAKVSAEFLAYRTTAAVRSQQRVAEVRSVVENYRDEAQIFLGGLSMITADMVEFIRSDITVFGAGIIAFIIVVLTVIFRQWQFVVLPLVTCLLTLEIMLGFLAAVDWRLTVISSNMVALLLIVTLAITIHLMVRYREIYGNNPQGDISDHLRQTLLAMAKPCTYTVLTTAVAFVSLVISGIRPVIDFGWMMVIGLSLAFALAFIVIPAGLSVLPKTRAVDSEDRSAIFTLVFSRFTERRGGVIIALGVLATVVSVVGIKMLKVENRFIDYFHSSTEIYQGMVVIDQNLGGTISLDIVLDHKREAAAENDGFAPVQDDEFASADDPFDTGDAFSDEGFSDSEDSFGEDPFSSESGNAPSGSNPDGFNPDENYWFTQEGLEQIERVHDYFDSMPEVGKVQSLAVAFKVARDLNGGKSLNNFELAILNKALPDDIRSFLVDPYLAKDREQTRITMRIKETDPNLRRNELLMQVKEDLVEKLGLKPGQVNVSGVLVLYNNMLQSLFRSQILTIGAVFFGILLMFLVLFRSLSLSLIALIPNMLAALVVLGGMGLANVPLDMMTITIAAIAVGIGVDNAIHYIYRFRYEFERRKNYIASMHAAHGSIGRAMYYTSITIIVGFSILAFSRFIPSIYFGVLTGLAMFAAIVASLTLLPKLMLMTKPLGNES